MEKWFKKVLGLAAIGSAAAGLVYYFKKSKKNKGDDFNDDFEDEDFDLDNDLQPADRGYVDLNSGKTSSEEAESESTPESTVEGNNDSAENDESLEHTEEIFDEDDED